MEVLQCTCLGMIISYVVLKSRSILLVSFLHALNNLVPGMIILMGLRPFDNVFSFGVGIYGTILLAVVAYREGFLNSSGVVRPISEVIL